MYNKRHDKRIARNAFAIYKQNLVKYDTLDFSKELSLRGINDLESLWGGQGIVACSCQGACKNCMCRIKNVPCNSKCHKGKENFKCLNKNWIVNIEIVFYTFFRDMKYFYKV